ncbi:hypothetical protein C2E23DRAFT_832858 [Lenzites betulinus]|nr:hypothetical protein C2E23DRAFT_832858 [Lenzites betulinus]
MSTLSNEELLGSLRRRLDLRISEWSRALLVPERGSWAIAPPCTRLAPAHAALGREPWSHLRLRALAIAFRGGWLIAHHLRTSASCPRCLLGESSACLNILKPSLTPSLRSLIYSKPKPRRYNPSLRLVHIENRPACLISPRPNLVIIHTYQHSHLSMSATTTTTLFTLAIPSKSRPSATYPSSPLKVFPPPAPAVRRPLRERCGMNLTLHIDNPALAFQSSKVPGPWSPKGNLQPHRNNLPRRRNPKPSFVTYHDKQLAAAPPKPAPAPPDRSYETGFTHIVEITHGPAPQGHSDAQRTHSSKGGPQRLRLTLPASTRRPAGRASLALTDAQLRAARDFLVECLPGSVAALPELAQGAVRALVVTPRGRPTDAMALVGCYLACVAGQDVEAILRCVDEEESVLSVWKGEVSGDEIEQVQGIACA